MIESKMPADVAALIRRVNNKSMQRRLVSLYMKQCGGSLPDARQDENPQPEPIQKGLGDDGKWSITIKPIASQVKAEVGPNDLASAEELHRRLKAVGVKSAIVCGYALVSGNQIPHAWVVVGKTVVDTTADQFNRYGYSFEQVYVGAKPGIFREMKRWVLP